MSKGLCLLWKTSIRYPLSTLSILLALTVGLLTALPRLKIETDLENFFPLNSEDFLRNDHMREVFGLTNPVIVGVVNDEQGVFNPQTLELVAFLSREIEQIPGVLPGKVKSLWTLDNIIGTPDGLEVVPFMKEVPESLEEALRLRDRVFENGIFVGSIVSKDATATGIVAEISEDVDKERFYLALKSLAARAPRGPADQIFIAGQQILEGTTGIFVRSDLKLLIPLVLVVLALLLYLSFGSLKGVALPLAVVSGSTVWTLGVMTLLGIPVYLMSFVMPIILISLGSAYGIHILSRYYDVIGSERDRRRMIGQVMGELWSPVVVACLTTATGFVSLGVSDVLPIRYMGFFTAFGIVSAMILSLTFIPAVLVLLPARTKAGHYRIISDDSSEMEHVVFRSMGDWVYVYRIPLTLGFLVLILGSLWGMKRLYIDAGLVMYMDPKSEVMVANAVLNEKFSGTTPLNLIVKTARAGDIQEPGVLEAIEMFQEAAEKCETVGGSLSIVDFVKLMNRVMHEGKPSEERIPPRREIIAQYFLLYSLSGDMDNLANVMDFEYQQANVHLFLRSDHSRVIARLMGSLRDVIQEAFLSKGLDVEFSGFGQLIYAFNRMILVSQVRSALVAFFLIFLMTYGMFRSLPAALFTLIPILLAVLFNFGLMGLLKIPLGISTAMISSIGMGIGIDYSIHFVHRYRLEHEKEPDVRQCIQTTMATSGKAIFFNALTISLGFLVLMLSAFPFVRELGLLLAVTMVASYLGATVAIPILLSWIRPGFAHSR